MNRVEAWHGLQFAELAHRFATPQISNIGERPEPGGRFGAAPWQPLHPGFDLGAERDDDCLHLNIWAPEDAEDLPVLLWFYGGGFEGGAASMAAFDGADLAAQTRCIVVTANYRVGFIGFGYFAHRGGRLAGASNLGVRDAIAAQEWVRRHIALFGGDPDRVTLAGQSSGGFLSCAAATAPSGTAPMSLALFSGGASRIISEEVASELGEALLTKLGIGSDPELLIELPAERILEAQVDLVPRDLGIRNGSIPRALGVVLDIGSPDPVVPVHPMKIIASGGMAQTRILSSATVDETAGFDPGAVAAADAAAVETELRHFGIGGELDRLSRAYGQLGDPGMRRQRLLTDFIYRLPAARLVQSQLAARGEAVLADIPRNGHEPAVHGADVSAIFARPNGSPRDESILRLFKTLILGGQLPDTGISAPAIHPRDYPEDVIAPETLLELWEGVDRP